MNKQIKLFTTAQRVFYFVYLGALLSVSDEAAANSRLAVRAIKQESGSSSSSNEDKKTAT